MNQPYIYESSKNKQLHEKTAIIVLPDIYCQTDYSKRTVEEFAETFKKPVFLVDYFYINTQEANNLDVSQREKAQSLMQNFEPDEFLTFWKNVLFEIKKSNPNIEKFTVIGFCFGGRLAYIAGGNSEIDKVISFYGGGANTPNYILGDSPIDYLISQRKGDTLEIYSFFGTKDPSIPEKDREETKGKMLDAKMNFNSYEYDAPHAYFQEGRPNYNMEEALASWEVLMQIL